MAMPYLTKLVKTTPNPIWSDLKIWQENPNFSQISLAPLIFYIKFHLNSTILLLIFVKIGQSFSNIFIFY